MRRLFGNSSENTTILSKSSKPMKIQNISVIIVNPQLFMHMVESSFFYDEMIIYV